MCECAIDHLHQTCFLVSTVLEAEATKNEKKDHTEIIYIILVPCKSVARSKCMYVCTPWLKYCKLYKDLYIEFNGSI